MAQVRLLTAEDLKGLADDYELYEGVPRGVAVAPDVSAIAANIVFHLRVAARPGRLGVVFGADASFRLARNPDTVFLPDAAFVRADRIRSQDDLVYPFEGPPDLAVEVRSPGDRVSELDRKMRRYLTAGTTIGWAIDPVARTVTIYQPDTIPVVLQSGDTLTGADLLTGFSVAVADIFSLDGYFS